MSRDQLSCIHISQDYGGHLFNRYELSGGQRPYGALIAFIVRYCQPWLRIKTQPQSTLAADGFTLIEVMVALLIAAIFTSVTMQMLVTSAAFRARAAQYDETFSWIQDDLEAVVSQANVYAMDAVPYSADCNALDPASGVAGRFITVGLGGGTVNLGTREVGGKMMALQRTATLATSDPRRLIELTYTATAQGETAPISTITSEVIPQAVLRCP